MGSSGRMCGQVGDSDYWSDVMVPARWVDMARKYDALVALSRMAPLERNEALRSAARAWPAALREAELAGPQVCARRRWLARARVCRPASTRAAGRDDEDLLAVILWSDLHALLADQLRFRARQGSGDSVAFVSSLDASARARWPDAERLIERGGEKVRPRQAYLWLATRSGFSLPQLNRVLFAREGHWDRRDDDPGWARIG